MNSGQGGMGATTISEKSHQMSTKSITTTGNESSSVMRILHDNYRMFPYKIQVHHQPLKEAHIEGRPVFVDILLAKSENEEVNPQFIWFSNQALFHFDGHVNKQNWCIWGTDHPHISKPVSLHPQHVTV